MLLAKKLVQVRRLSIKTATPCVLVKLNMFLIIIEQELASTPEQSLGTVKNKPISILSSDDSDDEYVEVTIEGKHLGTVIGLYNFTTSWLFVSTRSIVLFSTILPSGYQYNKHLLLAVKESGACGTMSTTCLARK